MKGMLARCGGPMATMAAAVPTAPRYGITSQAGTQTTTYLVTRCGSCGLLTTTMWWAMFWVQRRQIPTPIRDVVVGLFIGSDIRIWVIVPYPRMISLLLLAGTLIPRGPRPLCARGTNTISTNPHHFS